MEDNSFLNEFDLVCDQTLFLLEIFIIIYFSMFEAVLSEKYVSMKEKEEKVKFINADRHCSCETHYQSLKYFVKLPNDLSLINLHCTVDQA